MVSGYIYDYFNSGASSEGNTVSQNYQGSEYWGPDSSRIISSSNDASVTIDNDNDTIIFYIGPTGTFATLTYNYSPSFFAQTDGTVYFDAPTFSNPVQASITYSDGTSETLTFSGTRKRFTSSGTSETFTSSDAYSWDIPEDTSKSITSLSFTVSELGNTILPSLNSTGTYTATCLPAGNKVLTLQGEKNIEDVVRGDLTPQGRVARLIVEEYPPSSLVELAKIKKDSLANSIPCRDVLACSNHIFIYQKKKVLAKDLPKAEVINGTAETLLPDNKLYDIQYDFEGSYTVSGLQSQSRSPYYKLTPLPKELYFNLENYKDVRVDNTLFE